VESHFKKNIATADTSTMKGRNVSGHVKGGGVAGGRGK
jgi:hypothetical protein